MLTQVERAASRGRAGRAGRGFLGTSPKRRFAGLALAGADQPHEPHTPSHSSSASATGTSKGGGAMNGPASTAPPQPSSARLKPGWRPAPTVCPALGWPLLESPVFSCLCSKVLHLSRQSLRAEPRAPQRSRPGDGQRHRTSVTPARSVARTGAASACPGAGTCATRGRQRHARAKGPPPLVARELQGVAASARRNQRRRSPDASQASETRFISTPRTGPNHAPRPPARIKAATVPEPPRRRQGPEPPARTGTDVSSNIATWTRPVRRGRSPMMVTRPCADGGSSRRRRSAGWRGCPRRRWRW
jgi:hypothetical protein